MNDAYNQKIINTAILETGIEKTRHITALQQQNHSSDAELAKAKKLNSGMAARLAQAEAALEEANAVVADWQSAMEAWKDLAITLREEIKACPNHEAHQFGKNDEARKEHIHKKEDEERVKRNLKPKYKK